MRPCVDRLRAELADASRALHARGWVANHDGNLSARLGDGRLLATPTAVSKGDVRPEWLLVLDAQGGVLEGTRKVFSELHLHLAAFAARPDIGVVLHAHPPTATGFAVCGMELGAPFMAEPVVSLGPRVPLVPFAPPKDPRLDQALQQALQGADAVLLGNHGVLTVGGSCEQALLRMELVEHLAKIALVARQLGGPVPLPEAVVQQLAAGGRPPSQPSFAPPAERAPTGPVPPVTLRPPERPAERPDLRRLVAEAVDRAR
jgi:L-fuculose-phosphate aldolase